MFKVYGVKTPEGATIQVVGHTKISAVYNASLMNDKLYNIVWKDASTSDNAVLKRVHRAGYTIFNAKIVEVK